MRKKGGWGWDQFSKSLHKEEGVSSKKKKEISGPANGLIVIKIMLVRKKITDWLTDEGKSLGLKSHTFLYNIISNPTIICH
jgi:hypothetical protein